MATSSLKDLSKYGEICISLGGDLSRNGSDPDEITAVAALFAEAESRLQDKKITQVRFNTSKLTAWDSRVLASISAFSNRAEEVKVAVDWLGLPEEMQALLQLSRAVPPRGERKGAKGRTDYLELIGQATIDIVRDMGEATQFLGEALLSLWRFVRGKARYRRSDVALFIEINGPQALPIVGIINVLLGVIMGFMAAIQLRQFGAEIFVADLVAVGQTREIAPMMTAIVMAGRTGAAYAAQLGTMQVNEEIDALKTFGFSPMDFLVLPRMLALAIMFPILVLYADAIGMFGGYIVGVGTLGIGSVEYVEQSSMAIGMGDVFLGVIKGSVFGIIVAITGCMQGMQSGRSASAVGEATTKAVVMSIILIIITSSIFSVFTNLLDI